MCKSSEVQEGEQIVFEFTSRVTSAQSDVSLHRQNTGTSGGVGLPRVDSSHVLDDELHLELCNQARSDSYVAEPERPISRPAGDAGTVPVVASDQQLSGEEKLTIKKKKSTKHELFLPTSDEEVDTVVDRFWCNLNEGLLPEDLCSVVLYSGVKSFSSLQTHLSGGD